MTNLRIIQKRTIWLTISMLLFIVFGSALVMYGLKSGIDFTGGSLLEVRFTEVRPDAKTVIDALASDKNVGSLSGLTVQPIGDNGMALRYQETSEEKHKAVVASLEKLSKGLVEQSFDSVGPSIGSELRSSSVKLALIVLIAIIAFISYRFRGVSRPVASWKYGVAAVIALAHDSIITLGIFAVLGKYYGVEVNTPFVAAILTVIGYSNHDTIVVFDRIRENLPKSDEDFEGTVNTSLNQTIGRSINTSLSVILTLVAILIFGGASIRDFVLALTIGITIGTYSSIFVASPLLVVWEKMARK